MPFALIIVGAIMIVTGSNGTNAQLSAQLKTDVVGFTKWMVAIGMIGAMGYIHDLQGLSRAFMTLILIAVVLSNRGVFAKFKEAIDAGPASIPSAPAQQSGASDPAAALQNQQSGLSSPFGSGSGSYIASPEAQKKFNGWMNYYFGTGSNTPAPTN